MASRVFASTDLVRLIYSFGDPNHRKFTHELKWELKPWPEVLIGRFTERRLILGLPSYGIRAYLHEYSTQQIEQMLSAYRRCYCCGRHNTDKPMRCLNLVTIPSPCVFESHPGDCMCTCRHLSRVCIQVLQSRYQ